MSEQPFAVDVENVSKSFGAFKALNGIKVQVRRGEIYGLLGPNCAGKTTLIRCIAGLLQAQDGTVTVLGQRMPNVAVLRRVGYMTQQAALYPGLSVEENVRFFAAINGAEAGVKDALDFLPPLSIHRASPGSARVAAKPWPASSRALRCPAKLSELRRSLQRSDRRRSAIRRLDFCADRFFPRH